MIPEPPPGQGPIDPRGAFTPPPPPPGYGGPGMDAGQGGGANFQAGRDGMGPGMMPMGPGMSPPMGGVGGGPGMAFQPPPRRRRGWRRFFLSVLLLIAVLSLLLNALIFAGSRVGFGSSEAVVETVVKEGGSKKIVIVPVKGLITEATAERFDQFLTKAEQDEDVRALVIDIDTPGGAVSASDEMNHRMQVFRNRRRLPMIVSMGGMATSGGYYVACAGDKIFAEPSTLTGNIGVIMPRFNLKGLADKIGVTESNVIAPEAGFKDAGSWFSEPNARDQAYIQGLIDGAYAQFTAQVVAGRKSKLKKPIGEIANGKAYLASEALSLGLVDVIGYREDAIEEARTKGHLDDARVVLYGEPSPRLWQMLFGRAGTGRPSASGAGGGVTLNGINVNVEGGSEWTSPRPMALWTGR